MIRRAIRNGLIWALLGLLVFFKAIELEDAIKGHRTIEYPITQVSSAPR